MTKSSNSLFEKFIKFVFISGIGWLIDFTIFTILSIFFDKSVLISNIISSIPAITWVFFFSTKKIFDKGNSKYSLKSKYVFYIVYQIILVIAVSYFGDILYSLLSPTYLFSLSMLTKYGKLAVKVLITPITMTLNFFVMRFLSEKM